MEENTTFDNMEESEDSITWELKQQLQQQWETITISSDFIFCKVMQDEELLSELVRLILPDLKFTKLQIQSQHTIEIGMDIHGVRFDIFVTDETGTVIEIEMQVLNTGSLPKRIRYYSSMADTQMLEKGMLYSELRKMYIVMICPFDQYGEGRHMYTFTNRCKQNPELEMGDGVTNIVLNAAGIQDDVSEKLKAFLDYIMGIQSDDEYVKKLEAAVQKAKMNKKWRREYMTIAMRDMEIKEIARKEGRQEGRKEGREERDKEKISVMLQKGKSPQEIADFCDYPIELVKEVQESLLVTS